MDPSATAFIEAHGRPSVAASSPPSASARLPYPVVIPQRRPGSKRRGFVGAYPPALEEYGIDQDTFLDFIRALNRAVEENKWMVAVQFAAAGTSFVPNSIALGVSIGVQVIAGVIAQAEARWKTNSFLDHINNEFFRPRGLFCLLMSYKPTAMEDKSAPEEADAVARVLPSTSPSKQPFTARAKRNLRDPVAATVKGEDNLPTTVAPLIYPEVATGQTPCGPGEPGQKQKLSHRLNNYFDKRAQARYAKESNWDVLSNPNPVQFKNQYLDPTSAANNGGLLGLVSGGRLTQDPEKAKQSVQSALATQEQAIREQQSAMMDALDQQIQLMNLSREEQQQYTQHYRDMYDLQLQQMQQQSAWVEKGFQQRRLVQNILYLMIVNMPSDEEMAAARRQLNASSPGKPPQDTTFTTVEV